MKTLKYFENYWRFTKMCVRKKWQVFWVKLIGDLEFFFVIFAKWSVLMQEIQKLRKCDKSLLVFWGLLNSETPSRVLKLNFQFSFFIWKVSNRKKKILIKSTWSSIPSLFQLKRIGFHLKNKIFPQSDLGGSPWGIF